MKRYTDKERLEFLAVHSPFLDIGYPSVSFSGNGDNLIPKWGATFWRLQTRTLDSLRKEIDLCINRYEYNKKCFEQRTFDIK